MATVKTIIRKIKQSNQNKTVDVRLLDLRSASRHISVSYWTLRGMILRGDIPFIRAGRKILIDAQDLDRWIEEHKEQWS